MTWGTMVDLRRTLATFALIIIIFVTVFLLCVVAAVGSQALDAPTTPTPDPTIMKHVLLLGITYLV